MYWKTGILVWGASGKGKDEPVRVEKAFPAIISKAKFQRVNSLMRSRAPKVAHPRRVGSTYLLSSLVKCKACNRALSGQDAKSGQFSYYVCQSIMKRGKDACETPRLNARRFEEMVVGKIRSNVLTDSNIRALVKVVDEQMDGTLWPDRRPGGCGSLQQGQRHTAGQTHRLGRTRQGPCCPVHGHVGGQPLQPRHPGLLSEAAGDW